MLRIRLRRTGSKKNPHYRVVVAPSTAPRDGRFIEILGHYNPSPDPAEFSVKQDRLAHWLSVGAQPSDSLSRLLKTYGLVEESTKVKADESEEADEVEFEEETEEAGEETEELEEESEPEPAA